MGRIVAAVQAVGADTSAGVCCMDDLSVAHVNCYVADAAAAVGEEYQIAWLKAGLGNLRAAGILRSGGTRNRLAKVLVHILRKAGAVKGARAGCTVNIRAAEEALGIRNNAGAGYAASARCCTRNTAAARRLGRGQIAGTYITIAAAVLNLIPVARGVDYVDLLAVGKSALGSIRGTGAAADIQTGNRAVHRFSLVRRSGNRCCRRTGRLRRRQILGADIAITAAILDLIPVTGVVYDGYCLTVRESTLGSICRTLAGADIQAGYCAVHRLGRSRCAGRTGVYCCRRSILAADVTIAAAILDLIPAAGCADNGSCLALAQTADHAVRRARARTDIQSRSSDIDCFGC